MSESGYYPKVVRIDKADRYEIYDGDELGLVDTIADLEGTTGVALGDWSDGERVLVDIGLDDTRRLLVPADDLVTLLPGDGDYEEFETIASILEEIGDEWIGVDTLIGLSRLIPLGSFLWFEGEEIKRDGIVSTVVGRGLAEVSGDFKLVMDPENEFEGEGPVPTTDAEAEEFQVEVFIRPRSLTGGDDGTVEIRKINPLTTRVITRPTENN